MIVILEQPEILEQSAILYTGITATWCRGGCRKFRYPYCYLGDTPYCENCAVIAQLKPISSPAPQSQKPVCPPRKIRAEPRKAISPNIKDKLLKVLQNGPASSTEMTRQIGCNKASLDRRARQLTKQNLIYHGADYKNKSCNWYSLPQDKEQLIAKLGKPTHERILEELKNGPKGSTEIARNVHITSSVARKTLEKLVKKNLIVAERDSRFKFYALPEHRERLLKQIASSATS